MSSDPMQINFKDNHKKTGSFHNNNKITVSLRDDLKQREEEWTG